MATPQVMEWLDQIAEQYPGAADEIDSLRAAVESEEPSDEGNEEMPELGMEEDDSAESDPEGMSPFAAEPPMAKSAGRKPFPFK